APARRWRGPGRSRSAAGRATFSTPSPTKASPPPAASAPRRDRVAQGAARPAGIDLMEDRVAQGRERYPRLELTAGDASRLPWEDGSFDLVTHFTCLSSMLDQALRAQITGEMCETR